MTDKFTIHVAKFVRLPEGHFGVSPASEANVMSSYHPQPTITSPATRGESNLGASSSIAKSTMTTTPVVSSKEGSLVASSSNATSMTSGSVTSRERDLASSSNAMEGVTPSSATQGPDDCSDRQDVAVYPMHGDVLGFPSNSSWDAANRHIMEPLCKFSQFLKHQHSGSWSIILFFFL